MATTTANNTYNVSVFSKVSTNKVYAKSFLQFALPNLSGGTATDATLTLYASTSQGPGTVSNINIKSSNANLSWTESTDQTSLDGYALSTVLGTNQSITTPATLHQAYTWNVWGDSTRGVSQAYTLGNGKTTLCVINTSYTAATTITGAGDVFIEQGSEDDVITINFSDKSDTTYHPVLTITYTPGAASAQPFNTMAIGGVYY